MKTHKKKKKSDDWPGMKSNFEPMYEAAQDEALIHVTSLIQNLQMSQWPPLAPLPLLARMLLPVVVRSTIRRSTNGGKTMYLSYLMNVTELNPIIPIISRAKYLILSTKKKMIIPCSKVILKRMGNWLRFISITPHCLRTAVSLSLLTGIVFLPQRGCVIKARLILLSMM